MVAPAALDWQDARAKLAAYFEDKRPGDPRSREEADYVWSLVLACKEPAGGVACNHCEGIRTVTLHRPLRLVRCPACKGRGRR